MPALAKAGVVSGFPSENAAGEKPRRYPNFPNSAKKVSNINGGIAKVSTTRRWLGHERLCPAR